MKQPPRDWPGVGIAKEELNSRAACLSSRATQWLLLFHLTPPTSLLPIGIRWCIPSCALTSAAVCPNTYCIYYMEINLVLQASHWQLLTGFAKKKKKKVQYWDTHVRLKSAPHPTPLHFRCGRWLVHSQPEHLRFWIHLMVETLTVYHLFWDNGLLWGGHPFICSCWTCFNCHQPRGTKQEKEGENDSLCLRLDFSRSFHSRIPLP